MADDRYIQKKFILFESCMLGIPPTLLPPGTLLSSSWLSSTSGAAVGSFLITVPIICTEFPSALILLLSWLLLLMPPFPSEGMAGGSNDSGVRFGLRASFVENRSYQLS
jgi:hypothetical protein